MRFLYDVGIRFLGLGIFLGGLFHPKIRKRWQLQRQWKTLLPNESVDLWMHCASLGEFDQGLPLLWAYRKNFPEARIMVSFFSPSGFDYFDKRNHCVDLVSILPLDTRRNAAYFMDKCRPKMVVFVKYEFWLNLLFAVQKRNVPLYAAAALLREDQAAFAFWGGIFRRGLKGFTYFFVQNEESKQLLQSIGVSQVKVIGDPRYDNVKRQKQYHEDKAISDPNLLALEFICRDKKVLVVGSSWQIEEEILHEALEELSFDVVILAPHDIGTKHLYEIETLYGEDCHRFSQMDLYNNERIVLVDCIGLLQQLYRLGDVALIGGGFTGKLHNILEPAIYGLPVIFGPKYHRFPEAELFIERGISECFTNEFELIQALNAVLCELDIRKSKTIALMEEECGATEKMMEYLLNRPAHRGVLPN
ncbi:MAG: 3-deoxy-D-manno-octulosonic acid transferase [Flavobacteriia bacterium]|jgi:3-deoxy-D-manno-octulosonic-acid transferase|nr:3-deoxy-D-manno-octulosonic acid transferase [Flavobacteriia bacterium]